MNKFHWIHPIFLVVGVLTAELAMVWLAREQREHDRATV
jgi:hypothetical protein